MLSVEARIDFVADRRGPGFSLDVRHDFPLDGVTALFGPSGCGKTTLLRVIAGLERSAHARISLANEVWQGDGRRFVPAHRRGVGLVFQDARLFPHRSVLGNLRFAARRAHDGPGAIDLDGVIDALDLAPLLARRPGSLSGGERQRVAIGRTLLARPRLLLMDEPLAALDAARRGGVLATIARLPTVFGVPILYVTHSVDEVAQLADRMVVLSEGRVSMHGAVGDVLGRLDLVSASDAFEAGSLVEASVVGHDDRYHLTQLDVLGQRLVMPETDLAAGDRIRLRLRARDVALATVRPESVSIRNVLRGRVTRIRAVADSAYADVMVDIGGADLHARITRESVDALGLRSGTGVFALIKSIAVDRGLRAPPGRLRDSAAAHT